ncbi:MAG: FAD-dependent oxidoreductase [Propionibacteriaceae bacterium]|jgi:oxygen-dependent protoporphyrinogen oxidase|nr:FAD-dependent oxidoreductase [Propionibacteriaceae bacterium]
MTDVIVVGAGISGLAAAWRLQQAGVEVVMLESGTRAGGRFHSLHVNGCVMEAGANFVTDAYRVIPRLADQVGLSWRTVTDRNAVAIDGQLHAFTSARPLSAIRSGLMSWPTALSQIPGLLRFALAGRNRGTVDPCDWLLADQTLAPQWAAQSGLAQMVERSWRPAFNGFYFQDTAPSSAAAVAAMASHGVRQQTETLSGGLSTLTDAMAAHLDIRYRVTATAVDESASGVVVATNQGDWRAGHVIVALPGPALRRLSVPSIPLATKLAGSSYSAGLLVGLGMDRHLTPDELGGAYGILMHPGEAPLAALCVASRSGHADDTRDLVTCMFTDEFARRLASKTDSELVDAARHALLRWAPGLRGAVASDPACHKVIRLPHAMPMSPPGRLATIADYRRHADHRRVSLAGDSLAWPWSDSAAFAGEDAAQRLLQINW